MSKYGAKKAIVCDNCGEEFLISRCYLKRNRKHRFCSKQCEGEFKSLKNTVQSYRGGTVLGNGYRYIDINGVQREEHRVVMERVLGRPLTRDEVVHHINGNKLDNRPENLVVMTRGQHQSFHRKPREKQECRKCGRIVYIHGRGLCNTCYSWVRDHGKLADYPTGGRRSDE